MKHSPLLMASLMLSACVATPPPVARTQGEAPVTAEPMYFYPEKGQDDARQDRDRYDCYRWAVSQSGFDPGMTAVTLPPSAPRITPSRDGSQVAAGAVTGAVIGSVTSSRHHPGDAVVIGAIFSATSQSNQAARQAALAPLNGFRRAMGACMAGRGYRIG
jgi:hypothetical protein